MLSLFSKLALAVLLMVSTPEKPLAQSSSVTGAMEFVPGDTELYERGRRGEINIRSRVAGIARAGAETPRRTVQRAAIRDWENRVRQEFGPEYAVWRHAVGKIMRCDPPGGTIMACSASAIPRRR